MVLHTRIVMKGDLEESYLTLQKHLVGAAPSEIVKFALRRAAKSVEKVFTSASLVHKPEEEIIYD